MSDADAIAVRILGAAEKAVLDQVAGGVFDGPVDARWATLFLESPNHHLAVAIAEETVVGMASAVHYVHPDKAPELWVNEVGVSDLYRGRGIGKKLMAALFAHGVQLGCREAWVLTEADNLVAQRLYKSVGGEATVERPVYYTFTLDAGH